MIRLAPDSLNQPLTPLYVGRLSSYVFEVDAVGIPADVSDVHVLIERLPDSDGAAQEAFTVAGVRQADGSCRVYCSPWCFPDASEALHYHIMGKDSNGNPRWLGSGQLRVRENPANGSAVIPGITPADAYAYNPTTKLYHKLVAEVDEDGNITVAVEQEGVSR